MPHSLSDHRQIIIYFGADDYRMTPSSRSKILARLMQ
jgi:hypothetical protein